MKRTFKSTGLLAAIMSFGLSSAFTACTKDDPQIPDGVKTEDMWGSYTGKMVDYAVSPVEGEDGEEDAAAGTDITATIANDTIYFKQFPIKDIVMSIVGDETAADNIIESIGDVSYKIGYKPEVTAENNIRFTLDPKPLTLSLVKPASEDDEEPQPLVIEITVEAGEPAEYDTESSRMKFYFGATEVLIGEGENQEELAGFQARTFHFDMNKEK